MAKADERLATLESHFKLVKGVLFILIPLLITWGAYITLNVISMKQSLADHGVNLVAQLISPSSPQQLKANLAIVAAQVQTAKLERKAPNVNKVRALSSAVAQVVRRDPQVPEAWQAASALINFQTASQLSSNSRDCSKTTPQFMLSNVTPSAPKREYGLLYRNCTIVLDDASDLVSSNLWIVYHQTMSRDPNSSSRFTLFLQDAHVIYRGGKLLHVDAIVFNKCSFDFHIYVPPPPPARSLTHLLLASNNAGRVTFDLSTPEG